jgi:D-aminopeptidase
MRGAKNSITDVVGVRVAHLTFERDLAGPSGETIAARTGLTAVLPSPMEKEQRFFFASQALGAGPEITGFEVTEDFGYLNSPLVITGAGNLGKAYNAVLSYGFGLKRGEIWPPVIIGLNDSYLNGMDGECLEEKDILEAFRRAADGRVEEGSVGAGTGLRALGAKGGVGTSSRRILVGDEEYSCGVLAASHFGNAVGPNGKPPEGRAGEDEGALILIAATDVPLLPHQLQRIVRSLVARMKSSIPSGSFSDAVLGAAFTTANAMNLSEEGPPEFEFRSAADVHLEGVADAACRAAEEAVVHSLLRARAVQGRSGRVLETVSPERLAGLFRMKED